MPGPVESDLAVWPIFYRMSKRGLTVDQSRVQALLATVRSQQRDIECQLAADVGPDFNPASADQVARWMESRRITGKRTKKKGRLATDERALSMYGSPVLNRVVEFRGLQKLDSAFLTPLLGRDIVHPKWKLTRVRSGRVAMEDPNLLAFPARDEMGRAVRQCFVARPGTRLIGVDYAQIEPRIVAALSQDVGLLEVYGADRDLYTETARKLFHLEDQKVDPLRHRLPAKTTTLGVLYGIGPQKLYEELQRVGCGEGDPLVPFFDLEGCERLIDAWFATYPRVADLARRTVQEARQQDGWVYTVGGRGRFLPGLFLTERRWPHTWLREESERQAFNHVVQGTAQEIMKEAMLRVDQAGLPFEPLLQIHDELIGETPVAAVQETASRITSTMECDFRGVRLKAKATVADNWGDLK